MQFVRIKADNFKSFADLEVELGEHGFVKIDGVNATDSFSKSVGSGKSTIADAISYALTGETVKGNSSTEDVKNMYTTGICRVRVDFIFGDTEYSVIRGERELTLIEGGKDISKHLKKETQQLIAEKFPMFTPTFLGATVIIGQNMPNSFTNNKPSARKQILEELTNSSFMIEEVKQMLTDRKGEWNAELSDLNTQVVVISSQSQSNRTVISRAQTTLSGLPSSEELTSRITAIESVTEISVATIELESSTETENINGKLSTLEANLATQTEMHSELACRHTEAIELSGSLAKKLDEARVEHSTATMKAMEGMLDEKQKIETAVAELGAKYSAKQNEYMKLNSHIKSLKDKPTHCPTCKQSLPDAHTIDTTAEERELESLGVAVSSLHTERSDLSNSLAPLLEKIAKFKADNQTNTTIEGLKTEINNAEIAVRNALAEVEKSTKLIQEYQQSVRGFRDKLSRIEADSREKISQLKLTSANEINQLKIKLGEIDTIKRRCQQDIVRAEAEIKEAEAKSESLKKEYESKSARLGVLNQVISFATRDFRTILLTNIIQRLDAYAKSYCKKMLDTTNIEFKDDGNNISITYLGRDFGVLSGGESQIVKMCITLALKKTLEDLVGFTTNIMFFDEILDNCDQSTAQQIIELVSGLELSSTFFISHHEDVYLPIDKTWVVTKTNNISVLTI